MEILRKATHIDPRDAHSFIKMGELLISSDPSVALDSLNIAKSLLKKRKEDVSIEFLNDIGVLHFECDELELAQKIFMEALGNGVWVEFINKSPSINSEIFSVCLKDMEFFHRLEEEGVSLELPWDKVTTLFKLSFFLNTI